eukprot:11185260-Lingulodinium_polyedra.AAC.1
MPTLASSRGVRAKGLGERTPYGRGAQRVTAAAPTAKRFARVREAMGNRRMATQRVGGGVEDGVFSNRE